jgi:hypothetical protein
MRNEAKLGRTGACRRRRSSCAGRLHREVECAKRTQFGPARAGQAPGERKMRNEANLRRRRAGRGQRAVGRGANVRNEPNCPKRGTEAVSRLRISDCGLGQTRGGTPARRPIAFALRRPIAQSEPNFGLSGRDSGGPIAQNKAKPGQDGTSGEQRARERAIVQNKANLPPRARKLALGRDREGPPGCHCAKRTQFGGPIVQNEPNFHWPSRPDNPSFQDSNRRPETEKQS